MTEKITRIAPYNLWGNPILPLGYLGTSYTSPLVEAANSRLVKVLTGQRRAGKSYILRQTASQLVEKGIVPPENTLIIKGGYKIPC